MKLNNKLFDEFLWSKSQLLAVTKYWNQYEIEALFSQFEEKYAPVMIWFWENRVSSLKQKDLQRDQTHFIGNIQTKEIKEILKMCSVIHSVDNMKHIKKMEEICEKSWNWIQIFLQVNVDSSKPGWVVPEQIPEFLGLIGELENVSLIGFSAIGKAQCTVEEKQKEFDLLKELKNKYLPNGYISAGTSMDYKVALENDIDIIRIGNLLVTE